MIKLGDPPDDEVLTLNEAAAFFRVSRQTMAEEIRRGNIPAKKIGREFRILKNSLLSILKKNQTVSQRGESAAIVGSQMLTTLEPFLFESAPPTLELVGEFDRFCDALVLHDELIVLSTENTTEQPAIIDACSWFVRTVRLKELMADLDDNRFRRAFERELLDTVGDLGYVSPEQIASRGIKFRDRSAEAFQDQLFAIIGGQHSSELKKPLQSFFLEVFTEASDQTLSSDVNYFMRVFLYNTIAKMKGWSFVPNLARGAILEALDGQVSRGLLYSLMSDIAESLAELLDFKDWASNRRHIPVRSPVAYVVLDQAATPPDIIRVALRLRDEIAPLRKEFSRLVEAVSIAGNLGDVSSAVEAFEFALITARESLDWSASGSSVKLAKILTDIFVRNLRLSFRVPGGFGVSTSIDTKSVSRSFRAAQVAPILQFYGYLARAEDLPVALERLYGSSWLREDPARDKVVKRLLSLH